MAVRYLFAAMFALLLGACSGVWESPAEYAECSADESWISSTFGDGAGRLFLSPIDGYLHVLDGNGDLRRFAPISQASCRWSLDRPAADGGINYTFGLAADLDGANTPQVWDPTGRIWDDGQVLSCPSGGDAFAVLPSGERVVSNGFRVDFLSGGVSCRSSTGFAPWGSVLALAGASQGVWVAEQGAGGVARLVLQGTSGTIFSTVSLSATPGDAAHFCSATRLREGSGVLALLDGECGKLGLFSLDGRILATRVLASGGGTPRDVVFQDPGYLLLGSVQGSRYEVQRFSLGKLMADGTGAALRE